MYKKKDILKYYFLQYFVGRPNPKKSILSKKYSYTTTTLVHCKKNLPYQCFLVSCGVLIYSRYIIVYTLFKVDYHYSHKISLIVNIWYILHERNIEDKKTL